MSAAKLISSPEERERMARDIVRIAVRLKNLAGLNHRLVAEVLNLAAGFVLSPGDRTGDTAPLVGVLVVLRPDGDGRWWLDSPKRRRPAERGAKIIDYRRARRSILADREWWASEGSAGGIEAIGDAKREG